MNRKPDEYVFLIRTACPVTTQLCIEGCMGFGCLRMIRDSQEQTSPPSQRHLENTAEENARLRERCATPPVESQQWPEGYCLDPNGEMTFPSGAHEHWSFGYDMGYAEALALRTTVIRDALAEIKAAHASPVAIGVFHTGVIVKSLLDEALEVLRPNSPEDCPEEPWMRVELGKKFFKVLGKEHVPVSLSDERILEIARATFENIQDLPDDEVNGDTWDLLFARAVLAGSVGPKA